MHRNLGMKHHAAMLAAMAKKPRSVADLSDAFGWTRKGIAINMRALLTLKVIYIAGWTPSKHGVPPQPKFKLGQAPHAPLPMAARSVSKTAQRWATCRVVPSAAMILLASAVRALSRRPMSRRDLADATGMALMSACYLLVEMHSLGLVHIKLWARSRFGPPVAYYAWGAGQDAERPKRLAASQTSGAYAARKRAIAEGQEMAIRVGVQFMPAVRQVQHARRAA